MPLLDRAAAGSLRTLLTIRRDEPVAASLGRSTVRRRRWSCAVPFRDSMQSAGCRARPPSSGRSTRQCRNVKRSRRPPGATRRVLSRWLTPTYHPEHGEAGRGQRLIAHTHRTPCRLPSVPQGTEGMPPRRGSFFLRWPTALLVRAPGRNRQRHQSLCRGSQNRSSCGRITSRGTRGHWKHRRNAPGTGRLIWVTENSVILSDLGCSLLAPLAVA
jgi:hypothetical protein